MLNEIKNRSPAFDSERYRSVQIQTQSHCNADCLMCPYGQVRHQTSQGRMKIELFEQIIEELAQFPRLETISLMLQNEPLLDNRIGKLIAFTKAAFPNVTVALATNGSRLDEAMLDLLIEVGLDSLTFSLNGLTRETFKQIQRGMDFDQVMANLENLVKRNPTELILYIKGLIIKENLFEFLVPEKISELIRVIKEKGIWMGTSPISNRAGSLENYSDLLVLESFQSSKKRDYCHDPFETINILFNGEVIVCCSDWLRRSVLGNLQEKSLVEILSGHRAQVFRELIMEGRYGDLDPCRECSQARNMMKNLAKMQESVPNAKRTGG